MDTIHFLYPDENGCIYCKRINGLIKILPMKTPCLTCGKLAGTIQGAGCECVWNDFDFENGGTVAVFDPLAEYDRINQFKTVPKKNVWRSGIIGMNGRIQNMYRRRTKPFLNRSKSSQPGGRNAGKS